MLAVWVSPMGFGLDWSCGHLGATATMASSKGGGTSSVDTTKESCSGPKWCQSTASMGPNLSGHCLTTHSKPTTPTRRNIPFTKKLRVFLTFTFKNVIIYTYNQMKWSFFKVSLFLSYFWHAFIRKVDLC